MPPSLICTERPADPMEPEKIPLSKLPFSKIFLDYIQDVRELRPFYQHSPELTSFEKQIEAKSNHKTDRKLLSESLLKQYEDFEVPAAVEHNLMLLTSEKTFTVTTGHQLNLASGPLYFIYKIVSTINLARKLKQTYPAYDFVPVYWMATEDHDLEEINHFFLHGEKIQWKSQQTGPVGRMSTEGIEDTLKRLQETMPLMLQAYRKKSLRDATRFFVNAWFGEQGLVIVDGDDKALKSTFVHVIKDDIFRQIPRTVAKKTENQLQDLGYQLQILIRDVNFFYLSETRNRIESKDGHFHVVDTSYAFSPDEMAREIDDFPEKFSPNVSLRPLYQETVLPNIAYIGGPAEIAYWLQLKGIFDHYDTPFPVLLPRNFVTLIPENRASQLDKLDVPVEKLFQPWAELKKWFVKRRSSFVLDVAAEKEVLDKIFESMRLKATAVDNSLNGYVEARKVKLTRQLDQIGDKIRKAEEKRHEADLRQLEKIREIIMPKGTLQERKENIYGFLPYNPELFSKLLGTLDPLDFSMYLIKDVR